MRHTAGCGISFPRRRKGKPEVVLPLTKANEYDLHLCALWARRGLGGWSWLSSGALNRVKGWRR
jgi:hypothetical protein